MARQLQELQLGRLAMVAVLVYVIEEYVSQTSVLRETAAIVQELANVKSLETDLAQGVLQAEKGSSALLQELGNVKQLELDVASLSGKVTEFAKEGEELVLKDLQGSALENIKAVGEAKTAMLGVMGRNAKPAPVKKSEALPWSDRPKSLEGTSFAGDSGFDPLGLFGADPLKFGWNQKFYREAEIKHARLGMLAALAYPVQERLEPVLAKAFNLPDELKETLGRSPSIVNGGLEQGEIPLTIVAFLAGGAIVEYLTDKLKKEQGSEYVVGDIGLPYVGAQTVEQQALRQLQELQFGRVAMVAVLVYVIEESVFRTSVLRETAAIFQELANVKSLETDVAQGVLQAEKSSSAVIQELGNVKQLELDVASLSSKVTEFAKEGEELVVKDLEGSVVETVMNAGEAKTAMLGVMGRNAKPEPAKSEALPWAERPKSLEGTNFVGDSGFDPLGLFGADPLKLGWDQQFYREAELKHARLGMLAAVAFPVQEKLEPLLAKAFNLPDELKETMGRSPSLVNGGLEQV